MNHLQSIKLLCIKERTGNFFTLLGFNQSLHCVNIITEVLKYRYEVQYGRTHKRNLMGKETSNDIGRCVV